MSAAIISGDANFLDKAGLKIGESDKSNYPDIYDIILETLDDAKVAALKDTSGSSKSISSAVQSKWVLGTTNYNQSYLNEKYNHKYPKNVKAQGTCSEVAATILTEYYNRKKGVSY